MAERGFGATLKALLDQHEVPLAVLCYLNWVGGAVYAWSGNGTLSSGGHSYIGVGKLVDIDKMVDSVDRSDIGTSLTLNFEDSSILNEINASDQIGRDASITLASMNPATGLVTDVYQTHTMLIDQIEMVDGGSDGQITVRLATEQAGLKRTRWFALSDAHQQFLFSGDTGMEYATKMDEPVSWGRQPAITPIIPIYDYTNWWAPP